MTIDVKSGLIGSKNITIRDQNFMISKLPCTVGLRIFEQWSAQKLPIIGKYAEFEKLRYELLSYVCIENSNNEWIRLANESIVAAHVKDHVTLKELENEMREYNEGFLEAGSLQKYIDQILEKLPNTTTEILTQSWQPLLAIIKQHTAN